MAAVYLCSSCRVCSSSPLTFSSSSVLLCINEFISAKINALALTFTRKKRETTITLKNFTSFLPHSPKQLLRCTNVPGSLALLISAMPRYWFAWNIQRSFTIFYRLVTQEGGKDRVTGANTVWLGVSTGNLDWGIFSGILQSTVVMDWPLVNRTGEYWPERQRTERSEVRTNTTEGQYSPARLEQTKLVSS